MTHLESVALDYTIACLARGLRPGSLDHLRRYVDGDAWSRLVDEITKTEARRLRKRFSHRQGVLREIDEGRGVVWGGCLIRARRIARACLALYLRRVRRTEKQLARDGAAFFHSPWRSLWFDAPAYDPEITPSMRRGGR